MSLHPRFIFNHLQLYNNIASIFFLVNKCLLLHHFYLISSDVLFCPNLNIFFFTFLTIHFIEFHNEYSKCYIIQYNSVIIIVQFAVSVTFFSDTLMHLQFFFKFFSALFIYIKENGYLRCPFNWVLA